MLMYWACMVLGGIVTKIFLSRVIFEFEILLDIIVIPPILIPRHTNHVFYVFHILTPIPSIPLLADITLTQP